MSGPYPNGTVCVITRYHPTQYPCLGHVVTVTEPAPAPDEVTHERFADHYPIQYIRGPGGLDGYHPCAWMRPIDEDTDESDDEVIAAYRNRKRVPADCISTTGPFKGIPVIKR